jgi:Arc/MetJ-type ribon-helix-helix transcriptional regulator
MARIKIEKEMEGSELWRLIREKLGKLGIDLKNLAEEVEGTEGSGPRVRVVCVTPDLKESVEAMGKSPRDQVVMVRVDEESAQKLDAWVETGAVRSRSEAAALFIREGLKVRAEELARMEDALREVHAAKQRLSDKAKEVFGDR